MIIPDHNLSLTKEPIFKLEMPYKLQLIYNLRKQFERQIANNIKVNPKVFWNYALWIFSPVCNFSNILSKLNIFSTLLDLVSYRPSALVL